MSYTVSRKFLQEEDREGFIVPSKMKRAWAALIKTYLEVDRVCKKYGIRYFAAFGTLLGAIRHRGFIPWDDDIDLGMLRSDYMKFLSVSHEIKSPFNIKSIYTKDKFSQFHTVISNSREEKLTYNEDRIREFFGCPFIVGIDIDCFDYVPREESVCKLQKLMYYIGYSLTMDYDEKRDTDDYRNLLRQFNSRLGTDFDINSPAFFRDISMATDKIAAWCDESQADSVVYYPQMAYLPSQVKVPKACYDEIIYVDFENVSMPVPKKYDEILRLYYGDGYMVPVNAASGHDYPFYKGQEEYFRFLGVYDD